MQIKTRFSEKSRTYGTVNNKPSMTQQNLTHQCNVNSIVQRYRKSGALPLNRQSGVFGDFSQAKSFHEAQNMLIAAQDAFMEIPASIRTRFNNNPQELINFMENPENQEEAYKLGLADRPIKKEEPKPPEGAKANS